MKKLVLTFSMVFVVVLLSATLWNSYQAQHSRLDHQVEDKDTLPTIFHNAAFPEGLSYWQEEGPTRWRFAATRYRARPAYQVTRYKAPTRNYRAGLNHPLDAELGDRVAMTLGNPQETFKPDTLFD
jgi:hypothetical protein